jgi:hypothetical protein
MITIRYADLPEGLHARAERRGRRTVIYLRRGLTAEQRRLGLRRARQSARMGYGPRLPAAGVAQAVARDSVRGSLGTMGAVLRRHPVGAMLLAAVLAGIVMSYTLFVTGSIRLVLHNDPAPGRPGGPHPAVAPRSPGPGPRPSGRRGPSTPGSSSRAHAGGRHKGARPRHLAAGGGPPGPAPSSSAPAPSGSPTPLPSPSASPTPGEACIHVGPLQVCVPGIGGPSRPGN